MPATPCFTDFKETLTKIMPAEDAHALMELVRERAEARRIKRNEAPAAALGKSVEELIKAFKSLGKHAPPKPNLPSGPGTFIFLPIRLSKRITFLTSS